MILFEATPVPRHHRGNPLHRHGRWYSWSRRARQFFARCHAAEVRPLRPQRLRVPRCEPYGETFHLDPAPLDRAGLRAELYAFAAELRALEVGDEMLLFRDLYRDADPRLVDALFSWLRAELVASAGDPRAALFSPPTPARGKDNRFLLHADLFVVDKLWLIFDDVPGDGSGRSTFVPRPAFVECLGQVRSLPALARAQLVQLVHGEIRRDSFNRLYRLLHLARWRNELAEALDGATLRIGLRSGEGYLLNDRFWLHGRDQVSAPVGTRRFRRLTFGAIAETAHSW
jgi:hypothetical protein